MTQRKAPLVIPEERYGSPWDHLLPIFWQPHRTWRQMMAEFKEAVARRQGKLPR